MKTKCMLSKASFCEENLFAFMDRAGNSKTWMPFLQGKRSERPLSDTLGIKHNGWDGVVGASRAVAGGGTRRGTLLAP